MRKTQKQVNEFLKANDVNPGFPGNWNLNFRLLKKIVREENKEFNYWMDKLKNPSSHDDVMKIASEVVDAIVDIIWVVHNTAYAMGIDLEPFLDEIYRSNMTKVGADKDEDGKIMKSKEYEPPELRRLLLEQISDACNGADVDIDF